MAAVAAFLLAVWKGDSGQGWWMPQAHAGIDAALPSIELCGVGRVPLMQALQVDGTRSADLSAHLGAQAHEAAREEVLQALRAGPPRWRAAAGVLQGRARLGLVPSPTDVDAVAALSSDALASSSPAALGWAVSRCGDHRACSEPLLDRWLAVEPENAVPWLLLAQRVPAREGEALQALRSATAFNTGWGQLAATVLEAAPATLLPYLQAGLLIEAIGVQAAMMDTSFLTLLKFCRPAPAAGSARQTECLAWARLMVDKADTSMGYLIGLRLGELAGWPAAEVAAMRMQFQLLQGAAIDVVGSEPLSCAGVERVRHWVQTVARQGEAAAMRERAAAVPARSAPSAPSASAAR